MILFVVYAMLVWYLALRWRRRLLGFVAAGLGGVVAVLVGRYVAPWLTPAEGVVGVKWLVYSEAALVAAMGLFIAALPRRPGYRHCAYCRYDLRGLEAEATRCPECGQPLKGEERLTPIPSVGLAGGASSRRRSTAAEQGDAAQQQRGEGQAGDEAPGDR